MPFFSRVFRGKDSSAVKKTAKSAPVQETGPTKPKWTDAWQRAEISPEEVHDLVRGCTHELKARALHTPFLLLPFRPSSDPSAARTFVRNYFNTSVEKGSPFNGDALMQELRLTDPMVICSVMKWCWGRLPGGVVTWEAYELFKVGEQDSQLARDAFSTFIPISVDSDARTKIIFDFFDLMTAIAAHGKTNGLGGRKLSRFAGWWAFEHTDTGNGFEASYKNWEAAADATSHLFFAYLRSLTPDSPRGINGISTLPITLQSLVQATEYPPETPSLLQVSTTKVVMVVETVSPTPFALLRRAKNFEYRDSDHHLQEFASFEDPIRALTDECQRVLRCISATNQSAVSSSKTSTSLRDASWSRFEDIGFGGAIESDHDEDADAAKAPKNIEFGGGLKSTPQSSGGELGRPTTPSWADFMSSGFAAENGLKPSAAPLLLPPDKVLPPIPTARGMSSQSHKRTLETESPLEPGELASIATLDLDDSFWWVWISSLAGEEPAARKAVFGRCTLLETVIRGAKWLVLEEQIKGAAVEPEQGAYIVEKKRFFGFTTRRGKLSRRKSSAKKVTSADEPYKRGNNQAPQSKTSIGPDQHARIQAAAAALQRRHREQEMEQESLNGGSTSGRRGDNYSVKTNSVLTLQPSIMNEASQALKWASNYDKHAYRSAYLRDDRAGTGAPTEIRKMPVEEKSETPQSEAPNTSTRQAPTPVPKDPTSSSPPPPEPPAKDTTAAVPDNAAAQMNTTNAVVAEPVATETKPKQSTDSTEDPARKLKKKPGNAGFKSMFKSDKKRAESPPKPPMKPTGAETSTVAAARAALEAKNKAANDASALPPKGASVLKKKPIPEPVAAPPAEVEKPETPTAENRSSPERHDDETPKAAPTFPDAHDGPPRTGREAEYDALSRVDTNERAAADREFSRFDQGPLVEQPAFVPVESPVSEQHPEKRPEPEKTEDKPSSPPVSQRASPDAAKSPSPEAVSEEMSLASQDRWAQIRKNAAERAAQSGHRLSETEQTDEGDTSGEEAIESRVARIKARVAELTGNMEASR